MDVKEEPQAPEEEPKPKGGHPGHLVSLHPLSLEEALKMALSTPWPPKDD